MFERKKLANGFRVVILLLLAVMLAFPFASPARAAEIIPGNPDAYVAEDVVIDDDLFISGRLVQIDGIVLGDVFAVGEEVRINGRIDGNLFLAGELLKLNGEVSGNIFGAGISLQLASPSKVSGNVYFAGFSFQTVEQSQIARNVYLAGYQALLNGEIGRNVVAALNAFQLNGFVGRDVYLELNESQNSFDDPVNDVTIHLPDDIQLLPEGFIEGENATVLGELTYTVNRYDFTPRRIVIDDDLAGLFVTNWARSRIGEFMALLIVGLLLFSLWPGPGRRAVEEIRVRPFANMGWGLLLLTAFPLFIVMALAAVILLAILLGLLTLGSLAGTVLSLGGLSIAGFWAIFGLIFWMISKIVFAYLIGHSLVERVSPEAIDGSWGLLLALSIGLLLYEIARAIPILGFAFAIVVILIGLGSVFRVLWSTWQERGKASA